MRSRLLNQQPENRQGASDIMANDEVTTMMNHGRTIGNQVRQMAGRIALLAGCAAVLGWMGLPDMAMAQDAAAQARPTT